MKDETREWLEAISVAVIAMVCSALVMGALVFALISCGIK